MKRPLLITLLAVALAVARAQTAVPLVAVEWGQDSAYRTACPAIGGEHTQPGCVAVAMAQLLTVYRQSAASQGTVRYTTPTHGLAVAADLAKPIDWDDAADLIFRCGAAARTDYKPHNSTAAVPDMMRALADNFGLDTDMALHSRECYTPEAWIELVKEELSAARPLVMHARDAERGTHAFIIDGLDDEGRVHVNWGWSGQHNGWYAPDNLSPGPYRFAFEQRVLAGCAPDDSRETLPLRLEARIELTDTLVADNSLPLLRGTVTVVNRAVRKFSGKFNVALVATDGTQTKVLGNTYAMDMDTGFSQTAELRLPESLAPGTYTLAVSASRYATSAFYPAAVCGTTRLRVCSATTIAAPHRTPPGTPAYNASGRRVSPNVRGLVITRGRKHLNP